MPELFPYSDTTRINILLLVFLATFLIPMLPIGIYFRKNFPERLFNANGRERVMAILMVVLVYLMVFFWFSYIGLRENFVASVIGASLLNAWISGFFSLFARPSIHAAGTGTLVTFVLYFQYINPDFNLLGVAMGVILLSGVIWSSRLSLEAHDFLELIFGAFIGVISSLLTFYYMPVI
jgi:membrane-associated phospholipid phosphatase